MNIDLLTIAGCPNVPPTRALLEDVLRSLAPHARLATHRIEALDDAAHWGFGGSPSVLIDGVDLEAPLRHIRPGIGCRIYAQKGGIPPRWLLEAAVVRALRPQSLLFLCVANSARSQLAEGLARTLAPAGVRALSAGSEPTTIRPEAVRALGEIGVDASGLRAKGLDEIDLASVELVVTLCGEETCPVLPGAPTRLHWALPDPAAATGDDEDRLAAFRAVRDELAQRLRVLLAPLPSPARHSTHECEIRGGPI